MTAPASRYGRFSRSLHWGMAALFIVQFITAGVHLLFADTALEEAVWWLHKPLGALLLLAVVVRLLWALAERHRRPPSLNRAAALGHLALYALMIGIPLLALVRQYGSGKPFAPFGLPLMPGFEGEEIEWMTALGGLFHGELGWALLALIVGHVGMVLWHRRAGGEDVLVRMLGR